MYFSSIEFTEFPPFAKGSRMEFSPVADKPDDLAEVHLITGENGTGKSRLLCLLAAALGDARSLQARCRKEDTAEFAVGWRKEGVGDEPVMALRLGREGLEPVGTRSDTIYKETRNTPAFARAGVSFVEDADFSKAISEHAWNEGRLIFRPGGAYTESLLKKLHKIVVAARLGENDRMLVLTEKLEGVLSEVIGKKFAFFPRSHPEEIMCVKLDGGPPLSMSQCPDGLRSLVGWLVDAALVMDEVIQEGIGVAAEAVQGLINTLKNIVADLTPEDQEIATKLSDAASLASHPDPVRVEKLMLAIRNKLSGANLPTLNAVVALSKGSKQPPLILLDEIETHLHPGWQRQVLPAFQRMFPKAQIFVATHSPFVISSVNYGRVHILRRGEDGVRVETHEAKKGDSYMTAVQEVLGLTGWFDADIEKELGDFELLMDKAYTSNGTSEADMRNRAAHFLKPENRYSEEVRNMVTNLVAQYERHLEARK